MPKEKPQHRTRRWKRTAAVVVVLLLGGAIVNVAVACGCAIAFAPVRSDWTDLDMTRRAVHFDGYWILKVLMRDTSARRLVRFTWSKPLDGRDASRVPPQPQPESIASATNDGHHPFDLLTPIERTLVESDWSKGHYFASYGWPRLSMWRSRRGSELLQVYPNGPIDLPIRPIFPGFIINTIFYALLLWLIFFAPFAARRALRRKRRVCEKCAYPVGTSPVCTECGAAVAPRANENKAAI